MADFNIKAHDRLPVIRATLETTGVGPVNLASAEDVMFIMRPTSGSALKINSAAQVVSAAEGVVQYEWQVGDTDTPGSYQAEWEVHWENGKTQTFPTMTYHTIDVLADLDNDE